MQVGPCQIAWGIFANFFSLTGTTRFANGAGTTGDVMLYVFCGDQTAIEETGTGHWLTCHGGGGG
jgi:hypothetical protein